MRRHVHSNLDDLDLNARELAQAAARRSGMSLKEWAAAVLAAQDDRRAPQAPKGRKPAGDKLDDLIAQLSRTARPQPSGDYEALMAAIAAESERQAQDRDARTTIALESMASWIEQTEERLTETARSSADHQERMASALSQALSTLKQRLDTVEHQAASDRAAPARVEFPIQDAIKALSPLSENLTGLRQDVSRLAERLDKPDPALAPAVGAIRSEIERLRSSMGSLATREEIAALDHALKDIARDMGQDSAGKDLLTLAQSIAALYHKVQDFSDHVSDDIYRRLGHEIDNLMAKIDQAAQSGVDRSVIEFLSSQIVDMRQDLAHRAEPQVIERLSEEITTLGRQIADLRIHQVGRNDLSALKTSLESVCSALNRNIAVQEESDVPEKLNHLSRNLAMLVDRSAPEPADLSPITDQLALLTERMASLSESRFEQADALTEMIGRLSSQVQIVAEKEAPSQEPLMQRFDRIEQELQQLSRQTDTSGVQQMLRSIDDKLERAPANPQGLDALERQIAALAERIAPRSDEPLHRALDEAANHFKALQEEAVGIAERAARTVLQDLRPSLPDTDDLDALKQGFVELKALQTRADKKTQDTLRAVHDALETLVSRFPDPSSVVPHARPITQAVAEMPSQSHPEGLAPADRLEAAVRRLHAVALSQIEEVSTLCTEMASAEASRAPVEPAPSPALPGASEEPDLSNVRASFIAAARRAAQPPAPEQDGLVVEENDPAPTDEDEQPITTPSLIARIRRSFDSHRRPFLFGLAFLILAAGTAQILSGGQGSAALVLAPTGALPQAEQAKTTEAPRAAATETESTAAPVEKSSLFQPSSLTTADIALTPPEASEFFVDPSTVQGIPSQVPAALRQAALAGDAAAIFEIATQAAEGRGLPQNMSLALHLYERAAQAGLPPAQERLAMLLEKGVGGRQDLKQASLWYERAAQGGNVRAMHNLATLLASGASGKPDYATALRWYSEAAEAGLRDSQFNMGVLLARGVGTKRDLPQAYKWFALAAAQGDAAAVKRRDEIAARLSSADLAAGKSFVNQWRPRPVDPTANEAPVAVPGQTAFLDRFSANRS